MTRRYRLGIVVQEVLGWASLLGTFRRSIEDDTELDQTWIPISYASEGGWVERLPGLGERRRGALRATAAIARSLASQRYDAILFNATWLAVMAAPWTSRTTTAILTDVTPRQYDREARFFAGQVADGRGPLARAKHAINRRVLRSTSLHFPASEWTRRSLVEEYAVDPRRTHIIPFGVELEIWRPRRGDRSALPRVLFVGGDFHRKGGDLLLDWFRARGRGRCELSLVSADPAVRDLREPGIYVHANLKPHSDELRRLFWGSDVLCLPSRSEPFGLAAVEGHAAGLPVVTSDAGGLAEIVDDGRSGFRVPAGDGAALGAALDRLIDSPGLRHSMGIEARRRAEAYFDAASTFPAMIELLKRRADLRRAEAPGAETGDGLSADLDRARSVL